MVTAGAAVLAGTVAGTVGASGAATVPTVVVVLPPAGSCADATVTLQGSGLSAATPVTFDGRPATAVTAGPGGTLDATLPDFPPGTAAVTVQVGVGPATSSNTTTYTCLAPPVVATLLPDGGPAAGGTTVTVTGRGFGSGTGTSFVPAVTGVSFGADTVPAADLDVLSPTQLLVTSPAHPVGTVDVTVHSTGGDSGAAATDRFAYGPNGAPPSCAAAVSAADDFCVTGSGGTVTLSPAKPFGSAVASPLDGSGLGRVNPATGAVSLPASRVAFGQLSIDAPPFTVAVTLTPTSAVTGHYDRTTGELSLSIPVVAGMSAGGSLMCVVPVTIALQGVVSGQPGGTPSGTLATPAPITPSAASATGQACPVALSMVGSISVSIPVAVTVAATVPGAGAPAVDAVFPPAGASDGYTLVWVFGRKLAHATTVALGSDRVPWLGLGSHLLVLLASPAAGGPVDVRVTTAAGTSPVTPGDVFTYVSR